MLNGDKNHEILAVTPEIIHPNDKYSRVFVVNSIVPCLLFVISMCKITQLMVGPMNEVNARVIHSGAT